MYAKDKHDESSIGALNLSNICKDLNRTDSQLEVSLSLKEQHFSEQTHKT